MGGVAIGILSSRKALLPPRLCWDWKSPFEGELILLFINYWNIFLNPSWNPRIPGWFGWERSSKPILSLTLSTTSVFPSFPYKVDFHEWGQLGYPTGHIHESLGVGNVEMLVWDRKLHPPSRLPWVALAQGTHLVTIVTIRETPAQILE